MTTKVYRFGDYVFDATRGMLSGPQGPVPLRPKSFALLQHLLDQAGRLVGKDELMAAVWPGIVVTDDSITRCISEIRAAIGDRSQEAVKTVARRGYRFAAPVETGDRALVADDAAARVAPAVAATAPPTAPASTSAVAPATASTAAAAAASASASASASTPASASASASAPADRPVADAAPPTAADRAPRRWTSRRSLAVVALVAALALGLVWRTSTPGPAPAPQRLSIVVLPFAGAADDAGPARDVLPALVTEALTIALSRLHGSTVISSTSAATFHSRPVDVREVGRELHVRYVLQGSVIGSTAGAVRIAARLLDSDDGRTLWSDQFDARRGDLLAMQEAIVARLASTLGVALVDAGSRRTPRAEPGSPDAEGLALQCEARTASLQDPADLCERALALDPRNVRALAALALWHADRAERRQGADPAADQQRARAWADRALAIEPDYYATQCALAVVLTGERRVREAVDAAERCRSLHPSHAQAYRILAALHFFLGEPERALAFAEHGMVLSPRDPQTVAFLLFKGWATFMMGRDDDAIVWLRRAEASRPDAASVLPPLISVLALTGRDDEARRVLARYASLAGADARTVSRWDGQPDDNARFVAFGERFKNGLRRAGMAER